MKIPRVLCLAAASAVLLLSNPVLGQSGRRGTMAIDDGSQRFVLHYATPDVAFVIQPEFSRADAALFASELSLSDPQFQAVERMLEWYLEQFAELLKDRHPDPPSADGDRQRRMVRDGGPGERNHDQGGEAGGEAGARQGPGDPNPIRDIILEELRNAGIKAESFDDLPFRPQISVSVSMDDDGSGNLPQPAVNVSLSFGGNDDTISEEMRGTLQKVADAAVPRISELVKNREMVMASPPDGALSPEEEIQKKWSELEALRLRVQEFLRAKAALRAQLLAEVQSMLAEEQLANWQRFERTLRRVKTLPLGEFVGESVDLIALLQSLDVESFDELSELLDFYERQLDSALKRRNDLLETVDAEIDTALFTGELDEAMKLARRFSEARQRICDLNSEFVGLFAARLDEDGDRFRREFNERAHSRVYKPTIGQRAFEQASELADLTDEQRTAIADLAEMHAQLLGQLNDRIDRTVREEQKNQLTRQIERVIQLIQGGEDEQGLPVAASEDIAAAFRDRRDLDVRMMRSMYALLLPQQVAKLPQIPVTDIGEPVRADHMDEHPRRIDD